MNKIKYITMAAMAAILITSCEKEEVNNPNQVNTNSTTSDKKAENIMSTAYEKIGVMDKSLLINKIDEAKLSLDSKLNSNKSGEPILLEDIFTIYEAAINGTFPAGDAQDGGETYESSFTVPVTEDGGSYYVSETDFANFYLGLQADMNNELDPNSNEYFGLADLVLESLTTNSALISVQFVVRTSVPSFPIPVPSGGVYGADLEGWCAVSSWGIDAAVFMRGHVNSKAQFSHNPTPQRYFIVQRTYDTKVISQQTSLGMHFNFIQKQIWRSPNNACIGDDNNEQNNNQIWYAHFQDIEDFANAPLPYLNANYSNLTEFLYTTYKSNDDGFHSSNWTYPNGRFHHEGVFYYGLCIVC